MARAKNLNQMRWAAAGVSAALLASLLLWLTLSAHRADTSQREAWAQATQTRALLRATELVLRAAQNAESGQRGFLLTRDRTFLEPYVEAREALPKALDRLRQHSLGDPAAEARANRIEELATSRMLLVEMNIARSERGNFDRRAMTEYLRSGKQAMDSLRRELGVAERIELASLQQAEARAARHERLASEWRDLLNMFTVVLGLLFGAALVGVIRARRESREHLIKQRSEVIIEAGRHLLQSIIDSSANLIFVKTRRGEVLFANSIFRSVVQTPLPELFNVPLPPTRYAEDTARLAAADRAALDHGEHTSVELRLDVAGEERWFRVEKNPWVRDGKIIGVIGIARDETEIKNREAELERRVAVRTAELQAALGSVRHEMAEREAAQESLRQLQKIESLGQLTGGIAHDFNNMLAVVISALDMIRRKGQTVAAEELNALVETALAGATSAADLTARLLAFARQQALEAKQVNVNELLCRTRGLLTRTLGKNIEMALELDPAAGWIEVDESQLENALINLSVNARDAMPTGGRLTMTTRRAGSEVEITVGDTGAGMTADQLSCVFDPFFTTKEIGMGTGLGLSQVHGFVTQSGGSVAIKSAPGAGTTVTIRLPSCTAPAATDAPPAERHARPGQGELVLLVEDEALVRITARSSLQALGYRVIAAANGYEALGMLEQNLAVELMITDISMPGMTGRDLVHSARLLRPDLPILLTTGHEQGRSDGSGLPVLGKPYLLEELAAAIADALSAKSAAELEPAAGTQPAH